MFLRLCCRAPRTMRRSWASYRTSRSGRAGRHNGGEHDAGTAAALFPAGSRVYRQGSFTPHGRRAAEVLLGRTMGSMPFRSQRLPPPIRCWDRLLQRSVADARGGLCEATAAKPIVPQDSTVRRRRGNRLSHRRPLERPCKIRFRRRPRSRNFWGTRVRSPSPPQIRRLFGGHLGKIIPPPHPVQMDAPPRSGASQQHPHAARAWSDDGIRDAQEPLAGCRQAVSPLPGVGRCQRPVGEGPCG